MPTRPDPKHEFSDKKRPGYKLSVTPDGPGFITLCIDSPFRAMCFYLNPDDVGDFAAAVWECAPRPENSIERVPTPQTPQVTVGPTENKD